jgi:ribosomal protein S6--L-glutamate ligase
MKAAVISLGSKSSLWTIHEMEKYFDVVDNIDLKKIEVGLGRKESILYDGKPLGKYDCVFAKGSFRYAPVLRAITQELIGQCYMPIKPNAFTIVHDKFLTQLLLQRDGVPMPTTYLSASVQAGKSLLEKMNYPIIIKVLQGTQGKGVLFADSHAAASSMLDTLDRQPFLIQEFIDTGGRDARIIVAGDKILGAMVRKAKKNEERANVHAGGSVEPMNVSEETARVAIKTAKALRMDIGAIDILEGIKGPMVIEANLSPGLQGITQATGENIAAKIAKYLYEKTVEFVKAKEPSKTEQIFDEVGIDMNGEGDSSIREIITNLGFRGSKIILPEVVNKIAKFKESDECAIKIENGNVTIKKFS